MRSPRWWPQGITTSADSATGAAGDHVDGRPVLVTSAYSHEVDGVAQGARLTFVDLDRPRAIRYRHVLLVEPFLRDDGSVDVRPVTVHAGGIVWHGDHVHVAGTTRGFSSFRLDDIVRVPTGDATRLGVRTVTASTRSATATCSRCGSPTTRTPRTGTDQMRYSFASLDRSTTPHRARRRRVRPRPT